MSFINWLKEFWDKVESFAKESFNFGKAFIESTPGKIVLGFASILYPPVAPAIAAIAKVFESETKDEFKDSAKEIFKKWEVDVSKADEVIEAVSEIFTNDGKLKSLDKRKRQLTMARVAGEMIKRGILKGKGKELEKAREEMKKLLKEQGKRFNENDMETVPDHIVDFTVDLVIAQNNFNYTIEKFIDYAKLAVDNIEREYDEVEIKKILELGKSMGEWQYEIEDVRDRSNKAVRKHVAQFWTKKVAAEDGVPIFGMYIRDIRHIPTSLANLGVEAYYARHKY